MEFDRSGFMAEIKKRYRTYIDGLDKLLGGGFYMSDDEPLSIVIRGDLGSYRSLFGAQMLYGLASGLKGTNKTDSAHEKRADMYFIVNDHTIPQIENLMLNTLIPYCISAMRRHIISNAGNTSPELSGFTDFFFDSSSILASPSQLLLPIDQIKDNPERLIAENVLYYAPHTYSLYYRTIDNRANSYNRIYQLDCRTINDFVDKKEKNEKLSTKIEQIEDKLKVRLLRTEILEKCGCWSRIPDGKVNAIAIEARDENNLRSFIASIRKKARISVVIVGSDADVSDCGADFVFDLQKEIRNGYTLHYVELLHDSLYNHVIGKHQYKVREYGIEVFPDLQTYLKKKMSFHRSVTYTHVSINKDTFPQYLEKMNNGNLDEKIVSYDDFLQRNENIGKEYLDRRYAHQGGRYGAADLLDKIFLSTSKEIMAVQGKASSYDYSGLCTVVIGESNTFKRYLTMGSAFSSAVNGEDTLILSLNREKPLIHRRTTCPILSNGKGFNEKCHDCFEYFHFMNLYPENITPEEFVYLLSQDIRTGYGSNRYVKRIILDGLQVLDYNFPLLRESGFFLSTAMSICREKRISLYLLCDKHSNMCGELRALADNIVCTEKVAGRKLRVYIEKCSGYYNPPSQLYCGEIENIYQLFECNEQYEKKNDKYERTYRVMLNSRQIKNKTISDMRDFWRD